MNLRRADIYDVLETVKDRVETDLRRYLPRRGEPSSFFQAAWELIDRGGKRFRPALTLLACRATGGEDKKAIHAASAVELLHNMTLVHDDVEDSSELRRNQPCVHVIFGVPAAINTGDAMLIKVFEIATEGVISERCKVKLVRQIAKRAYDITIGQALELDIRNRTNFTESQVINVLKHKTGALTALAVEAGAIVAEAKPSFFSSLSRFGLTLGVGFQIIDDALNLTGDVEKYGKEIGGDIREGKRTIMAAHLLRTANHQARERFLSLLGKPQIQPSEIKEAIEIYREYGSIHYAKKKAEKYMKEAVESLKVLPDSDAKAKLQTMSTFLLERTH